MKPALLSLLSLIAGCATAATTPAASTPATVASPEAAASPEAVSVDALLSPWARSDGPGVAVAVVRRGEVIYARGHGSADLEHGVAIAPDTVFQVASVSKQITAFALLMLAEQGKLSLDDDVREHLPEVPDFGHVITLRHLLHHTSGVRDQWPLWALSGRSIDDRITQGDIMALVRHQRELSFVPGSEFSYSNTGYTLLAEVVARVAGQSFADFTAKHLFQPLGMRDTHAHDDLDRVVPRRARSYSPAESGAGYRNSVLSHATVGATGLYTTVEDMARWAHNLDTGAVGGAAVIARMHERAVVQGVPIVYASGQYHGEHRGVRFVGHSGGDAAYRASLMRYPDHGLAVIVLSNDGGFRTESTAHDIAAIYLAEHMRDRDEREPPAEDAAAGAPAPGGPRIDSKVLDTYAGTYRLDNGMQLDIRRDGQGLVADIVGQTGVALVAESDTRFLLPIFPAHILFEPGGAGPVRRVALNHGGVVIKGERVETRHMGADELARYAGVYFSPELEVFYTIEVQGGQLMVRHRRNGEFGLTAVDADTFSSETWYFQRVVFTRAKGASKDEPITGMQVSNGRMRNVRFDRQPAR